MEVYANDESVWLDSEDVARSNMLSKCEHSLNHESGELRLPVQARLLRAWCKPDQATCLTLEDLLGVIEVRRSRAHHCKWTLQRRSRHACMDDSVSRVARLQSIEMQCQSTRI